MATRKASKKAARKKPTRKQEKFVEGVLRHGNATKAARDAGYKHPNVQGAQNLAKLSIQERIEARRGAAMMRAQIHTDVIVGSLVEIAGASVGDVLDENGEFNLQSARDNGTDHLLKKVKVTTFDTKDKDGNVTSTRTVNEYEMYSRLDALNQLRDTFGLKEEPRPNSLDERKRLEVEASLARIMERDQIDKRTAAERLVESLRGIPGSEGAIKLANEYVN